MCKWCEFYRFTIRADNIDNDKETHFLKPCYCPMCGHNFALDNEVSATLDDEGNTGEKVPSNNYFIVKLNENLCPDKNKRYFEGCDAHWDGYNLSDLKHAKQFNSVKSAKMYADWFLNEDDYEIEGMLKVPKVKAESTKVEFNSLSHFTEEDFYLRSDSGSVVNNIFIRGKQYKFPKATIEKINKLVDTINKLDAAGL